MPSLVTFAKEKRAAEREREAQALTFLFSFSKQTKREHAHAASERLEVGNGKRASDKVRSDETRQNAVCRGGRQSEGEAGETTNKKSPGADFDDFLALVWQQLQAGANGQRGSDDFLEAARQYQLATGGWPNVIPLELGSGDQKLLVLVLEPDLMSLSNQMHKSPKKETRGHPREMRHQTIPRADSRAQRPSFLCFVSRLFFARLVFGGAWMGC